MSIRILFVITARGGSKGIPNKNLQKIGDVSLVGYKAISALRSRYCSRLIISTDSLDIQKDARFYGVEVPFTRPMELATDTASSMSVIQHTIDFFEMEEQETYDAIMLLEPSSPFARSVDYDRAVEIMVRNDANIVVGMREMEMDTSFIGPIDNNGCIYRIIDQIQSRNASRRQDAEAEFTVNGALYLFRWDFFKKHGSFYADGKKCFGYVMDRYRSIEIDEMIDLQWARFLVQNEYIDL